MPDLCFYAPWIMKEPIPNPFRMMLEKAGKKRVSYDEADCSMRNIRKQGKVSRRSGKKKTLVLPVYKGAGIP